MVIVVQYSVSTGYQDKELMYQYTYPTVSGGSVVVVSWVSHYNDEGIMSLGGELTCSMGMSGNSRIASIEEHSPFLVSFFDSLVA